MTDHGTRAPGAPGEAARPPALADIGARLRAGGRGSAELTAGCLRAIDRTDRHLGAVLALDPTAAEQAAAADRRLAAGRPRGPLEGIPVLLKDSIDTAGLASTAGSRLLAARPPTADAPVVGLLKAAGAVVLGKTNLTEWSSFRSTRACEGWSGVGGQTRNPHRRERTPGGSSSGSAAAVAAGMAPLALGTETDGSIVGPAGHCGVAGIKPPPGMLPSAGVVPISDTEDAVGLIAPTLRDAALALGALGGTPAPDPRPPGTLRLGLWRLPGLPRPAALAVARAVERLTAEGATVVEVEFVPDREMLVDGLKAMYAEFRPSLERYLRTRPGVPQTLSELIAANLADPVELSLFGQDLFESALRIDPAERRQAPACRARAVERSRALLDGLLRGHRLDAVIAASNEPAWVVEHGLGDPYSRGSSTVAALARRCNTTIPLHPSGLPVGLSVFGPADTAELLAVALGVESTLMRTAAMVPGILPMAAYAHS